jgi:uncharacterized protein involved in tolerance to divalent cations
MMRYVARNSDGKIVSSYEQPQQGMRLNQIDDQSEEYQEWLKQQEE